MSSISIRFIVKSKFNQRSKKKICYCLGVSFNFQRQSVLFGTACQIYNDASLLAFYPFDTTGTFSDYSANYINGISMSTTSLSKGRLNQAIYFASSPSFFQALSYATVRTLSAAFSFSLWVNPASVGSGGSLVHVSSLQNGSGIPCYDLLAFTSTGAVVAQVMLATYFNVSGTQGSILPINTWTHIAVIYGQTNGLRLFINGTGVCYVSKC